MTDEANSGGMTGWDLDSVDWCDTTRPTGPTLVTDRVSPCSIQVEDVMRALRSARNAMRRGEVSNLGIWLDGRAAHWDFPHWLASDQDLTLDGYINRVLSQSSADFFCYSQFNLQTYDFAIWDWASRFAHSYAERVGRPDGEVDVDMFLGRYPMTPRGIHRDTADTLMFVLSGRKRLLFWPSEMFEHDARQVGQHGLEELPTVTADACREKAIILEGGSGDVFFWPADYWHIGEAQDATQSSLALNIGFNRKPRRTVSDALLEFMNSIMPKLRAADITERQFRETYLRKSDMAMIDLLAEKALIDPLRELLSWWGMRTQSAASFHAVPPLREDLWEGKQECEWTLARPGAVVWALDSTGTRLDVAANGHLLSVPASPDVQVWLASLAGNNEIQTKPPKGSEELVRFLAAASAICAN